MLLKYQNIYEKVFLIGKLILKYNIQYHYKKNQRKSISNIEVIKLVDRHYNITTYLPVFDQILMTHQCLLQILWKFDYPLLLKKNIYIHCICVTSHKLKKSLPHKSYKMQNENSSFQNIHFLVIGVLNSFFPTKLHNC